MPPDAPVVRPVHAHWTPTLWLALCAIGLITLFRIVLLAFDTTDLFVDEAQYWFWGQNLAFGYTSKPPMIAWVLRAATTLAGSDAQVWVRMPAPLFHMATAILLMQSGRLLFDDRIAALSGLAYITLPGVAFASILMSTDTLLLTFYALALLAYLKLARNSSVGMALVLGIAIGLGLLSKYAMLYFVATAALAALCTHAARIAWRDAAIAAIAAMACIGPNLVWNGQNGGATLRHTAQNAGWNGFNLHLDKAGEFLLAQFGVVGPVMFAALLWAVWRWAKGRTEPTETLLLLLCVPILLAITGQALLSKAYANWGVTAYIAGTLLATALLFARARRALVVSLAINAGVTLALPVLAVFAGQITLPNGQEAFQRYLGRHDLSRQIGTIATKQRITTIVADNRDILADLFYTLRNTPVEIFARASGSDPRHYYAQRFPLPSSPALRDVLYATTAPLVCRHGKADLVRQWTPGSGYMRGKTLYVYATQTACLLPDNAAATATTGG